VLLTVFWRHFMTNPCQSDWQRRASPTDEAVPTVSDWQSYVKSSYLARISVGLTKLLATSSVWRSLICRFIPIRRTKLSLSPWLSYFSGCIWKIKIHSYKIPRVEIYNKLAMVSNMSHKIIIVWFHVLSRKCCLWIHRIWKVC